MAKSRLQAIKDRAREIDSGGTGRASFLDSAVMEKHNIKKFKIGDKNWVCIIPPKDELIYYGLPLEIHYRIGAAGDAFLCLERMFKEPCPICEERNRLYEKGDVEKSAVRPLFPSTRCLFLVVDFSSEASRAEGLMLFDSPFSVEQGAKKAVTNKRTGEVGDISDPVSGKVLYFDCANPGKPTAKYDGYAVEDRDPLKQEWLDGVFDLAELLVVPKYDEVAKSLHGGNGSSSNEPEPESEPEPDTDPTSSEIIDHIADDIESSCKPEPEASESDEKPVEKPAEEKEGGLSSIKARIAAARAKAS